MSAGLQAQHVDSVLYRQGLATYMAAVEDYRARDFQAAFDLAVKAERAYLAAGDTVKACTAMELQSLSCQKNYGLALEILARAIAL